MEKSVSTREGAGPLTTGRVTAAFDNGPVECGTFDDDFYTKFSFTQNFRSKITVTVKMRQK